MTGIAYWLGILEQSSIGTSLVMQCIHMYMAREGALELSLRPGCGDFFARIGHTNKERNNSKKTKKPHSLESKLFCCNLHINCGLHTEVMHMSQSCYVLVHTHKLYYLSHHEQ